MTMKTIDDLDVRGRPYVPGGLLAATGCCHLDAGMRPLTRGGCRVG
jgi:hypothetical protein